MLQHRPACTPALADDNYVCCELHVYGSSCMHSDRWEVGDRQMLAKLSCSTKDTFSDRQHTDTMSRDSGSLTAKPRCCDHYKGGETAVICFCKVSARAADCSPRSACSSSSAVAPECGHASTRQKWQVDTQKLRRKSDAGQCKQDATMSLYSRMLMLKQGQLQLALRVC